MGSNDPTQGEPTTWHPTQHRSNHHRPGRGTRMGQDPRRGVTWGYGVMDLRDITRQHNEVDTGTSPVAGAESPKTRANRRPTTSRSDTQRRPIYTVGRGLHSTRHACVPRSGPAGIPRQGRTHGAHRVNHGNELRACRNLCDGELIRIF